MTAPGPVCLPCRKPLQAPGSRRDVDAPRSAHVSILSPVTKVYLLRGQGLLLALPVGRREAAPGKCEVKRHGALGHSNVSMTAPLTTILPHTFRSCPSSVRVIPATQKPVKMLSSTICVRGLCHGIPPRFLLARADRCSVVVPEALWAVAIGAYGSSPTDSQAADAAPHTLQRAQALSGAHA